MSIQNFVSVEKHHRGYLCRYDEARRFASEIKGQIGDDA